jgi:hypothetical protein
MQYGHSTFSRLIQKSPRTVPVTGSQTSPPLQPPLKHELTSLVVEKSQSRLPCIIIVIESDMWWRIVHTHIRPAFQSFGIWKEMVVNASCSQLFNY